jgi:hypothetical protein
MSGKGSKRRPLKIDRKQFESNWDKIFQKKNEKPIHPAETRYPHLRENDQEQK